MRRVLKRIFRIALRTVAVLIVASLVVTLLYRWVNPPVTPLMLSRALHGAPIRKEWVGLDEISPSLVRAAVASEDNNFLGHRGFDLGAIYDAIDEYQRGKRQRGASTIS